MAIEFKNIVRGSDPDWTYANQAGLQGIAINSDYAFISAYKAKLEETDSNVAKGAVYVFKRNTDNTWGNETSSTTLYKIETEKIVATGGGSLDYFGFSVASGNYLIIGAYNNSNNYRGAAYIFELSSETWTQKHKLVLSVRTDYAFFGSSVSITENYAIVGAFGNDDYKGAAYIFERGSDGNWGVAAASGTDRNKTAKLVGSDSVGREPENTNGDQFGWQ